MADYKVAVELSMVGGIAAALAAVSRQMLGIHGHTKQIEKGFRAWNAALIGVVAGAGAIGIVTWLDHVAAKGDKLMNAMARLKLQGHSTAELSQSYDAAVELSGKGASRIFTPSAIIEATKDLHFTVGEFQEAIRRVPELAEVMTIALATREKEGGTISQVDMVKQAYHLYKTLEEQNLLGSGRDADARKVIEGLVKVLQTGGQLDFQQYRDTVLKSRREGYSLFSPEALAMPHPFATTTMPWMMQGMGGTGGGGSRGVGPALDTFASAFIGRMPRVNAKEWDKLGLLDEKGIGRIKFGGTTTATPKNAELAREHPYEFMKYLVPELMKRGFDSQAKLVAEIGKLWNAKTGAAAAMFLGLGGPGLMDAEHSPGEKHIRIQENALPFGEALEVARNTPAVIEAVLMAQRERLEELTGKVLNPVRLEVLKVLTDLFSQLGNFAASQHGQQVIKDMGGVLVGLAAGLAALGSAAVLGSLMWMAGPGGLLFALGAALAAMSPKVHQALDDLIGAVGTGDMAQIKLAGKNLALQVVSSILSGMVEAQDAVVEAAKSFGQKVFNALKTGQSMMGPDHDHLFSDYKRHSPAMRERLKNLPTIEPYPFLSTKRPGQPSMIHPQSFQGGQLGGSLFNIHGANVGGSFMNIHGGDMGSNFMPSNPGGLLNNASLSSPGGGGGGSLNVHNVIHLDGAAIARAVNQYMSAALEHPEQSSSFDGRSNFTSPDWQPVA